MRRALPEALNVLLRWMPLLLLFTLAVSFGIASPRFLTVENCTAILAQSSWLIVVALGMNFVLMTGGVDLSVGATMYISAVVVSLGLATAPIWLSILGAIFVGAACGSVNGLAIVRLRIPAFIATLALAFIGRGLGLYLSSTKVVFAGEEVAELGRSSWLAVPLPLLISLVVILIGWALSNACPFGVYVRAIGADANGAVRSGVPTTWIVWGVYALSGALAGLGGFMSLSQTSSASGAFGVNAEFLAISAAVLGGTSLFGGRGTLRAPAIGALLVTMVQNGLVMINATPYAYPVITGVVILVAALLDSVRLKLIQGAQRRPVYTQATS